MDTAPRLFYSFPLIINGLQALRALHPYISSRRRSISQMANYMIPLIFLKIQLFLPSFGVKFTATRKVDFRTLYDAANQARVKRALPLHDKSCPKFRRLRKRRLAP